MRERDPITTPVVTDDGQKIWEGREPIPGGGYRAIEIGCQFRDRQPWPPPQWHGRRAQPGVRVWRSTLVRWEAVDDAVARLARVTDLEREVAAHRPAAAAKDVTVWWACRRCGCVTRRPEHAPETDLQHYTDCAVDVWQSSRYASKLLKCHMQVAQGVVARSYRCWECRRVCSEAAIEDAQERISKGRDIELRIFHRSHCKPLIEPAHPRYKDTMRDTRALIPFLAALYHEAVRHAVQSGQTLAAAEGRPVKFTEYGALSDEHRRGRELTAEKLLERFDFASRPRTVPPTKIPPPQINAFAVSLHEAERASVEAGLSIVKLDKPWTPFDQLPPQVQDGRRSAAKFLLERFVVTPLDPAAGVPLPAAPATPPAPLAALQELGVDSRHGDAYVVGLAVEHVGYEITLSFDARMSDAPWAAHCYVEQPLESEPKLVQASGPSPRDATPRDAIDACVAAAEEAT